MTDAELSAGAGWRSRLEALLDTWAHRMLEEREELGLEIGADTYAICIQEVRDLLAVWPAAPGPEPEPHVEALMDRAGTWQAEMFDDELRRRSFTTREKEAQQIIADLMLCISPPSAPMRDVLRAYVEHLRGHYRHSARGASQTAIGRRHKERIYRSVADRLDEIASMLGATAPLVTRAQLEPDRCPKCQQPTRWVVNAADFEMCSTCGQLTATVEWPPVAPGSLHASAPADHKCADCTIDGEACPTCYQVWWQRRHPHTQQIAVTSEDARLTRHTEAVAVFLNELYAIMVDPCAEGSISVDDMKASLLAAAIRDRDASVRPWACPPQATDGREPFGDTPTPVKLMPPSTLPPAAPEGRTPREGGKP